MDAPLDLGALFAKGDRMFDESRPGFVHAERKPGARPDWTELTFPGGLVCITNSSPVETELMYNEIFIEQEYLSSRIEVKDGDTIVDVGANVGIFTLFILSRFDHATLHSVEPVPATFEVLQKNLEGYPNRDLRLHNTALGAEAAGRVEIVYYPHLTGNSTVRPEKGRVQREVLSTMYSREEMDYIYEEERLTVPVTTLSALMRTEGIEIVDLLKLDAEGSEIDILRGIEESDWRLIKQLSMEVHDVDNLLPRVLEILTAHEMKPVADESTRDPYGDIIVTAIRE